MYRRLQPILNVRDLEAEKQFYVQLGFTVSHQAAGFVALSCETCILFGLQAAEQSDPAAFEQQMF